MCVNTTSSPSNMNKKKKVSFFDHVKIREIKVIGYEDWSEPDEDDDIYGSECDYQTDLEQDLGDYHEDLNSEPRRSQCGKYSSKSKNNKSRKTLDFSGQIYSSSIQSELPANRINPKFLPLPTPRTDRWNSASSFSPSKERSTPQHEQQLYQFRSETIDSMEFTEERLNRLREDSPYYKKGTHLPSKSYVVPSQPVRRTSSTESMVRSLPKSSSGTSSNWKRITSAPALMRRKTKGSKNRPTSADSRNATFGTKPPLLPTRWGSRRNMFLLEDRVNEKNKNLIRLSNVSDSSRTSATSSASTINNYDLDIEDDSDNEFSSELHETRPFVKEVQQKESSTDKVLKSPKNRRSLLKRGMGSLRSLTTMSPLTRKKCLSSDMPPKRPIRLSSVKHLQIEDISAC